MYGEPEAVAVKSQNSGKRIVIAVPDIVVQTTFTLFPQFTCVTFLQALLNM